MADGGIARAGALGEWFARAEFSTESLFLFGTDDVIYIPENQHLVFDDVYHWRRIKIDVRRMGVRIRTGACDEVAVRVRGALELCRKSPRFSDVITQVSGNVDQLLSDLAVHSGAVQGEVPGSLTEATRNEDAAWWVRVTDLPAESFFEADYERDAESPIDCQPHLTYGQVHVAQLDGLDIELPGTEEEGLPFAIDLPRDDGLSRWTIPPLEPLPLVREFCGSHGASAYGRTVNIATNAEIADSHRFCTPIGRIGSKLFATLYVSYDVGKGGDVIGRVPDDRMKDCMALLEQSHFTLVHSGPTWRIFQREGDVVHLYSGLAGKESEGVETMPGFMLVASAAGQYDPLHRAELFEAIRETLGRG